MPHDKKILIADDSPNIRRSMKALLEDESYSVTVCENGEAALECLTSQIFQILFLDVMMPGIDGIETLKRAKELQPECEIIMISGHASLETAVQATRLGATNFLEKPLQPEKLLLTAHEIFERLSLADELQKLQQLVSADQQMLGAAPAFQQLRNQIATIAPTDSRVFIFGENGSGKELVAREIHQQSKRAGRPFLKLNCAAVPADLIESELFGHEKGAFTGAIRRKPGLFEEASTGTLFLDEIGDMALEMQAKLLRVLQENEFMRVGGNQLFTFDVRIFAATNKKIQDEIAAGNFREDLYYRLNVIPIQVPPLRERQTDIPLLARHFLSSYCHKNQLRIKQITAEAIQPLQAYNWPGNVRELRNIMERLAIMTPGDIITVDAVTRLFPECHAGVGNASPGTLVKDENISASLREQVEQFERSLLSQKFLEVDGNVTQLAKLLKTDRANLHRKLKKYQIK